MNRWCIGDKFAPEKLARFRDTYLLTGRLDLSSDGIPNTNAPNLCCDYYAVPNTRIPGQWSYCSTQNMPGKPKILAELKSG